MDTEAVGPALLGVDDGFAAGAPGNCAVAGRTACAESGEVQLVSKNVITNIELTGTFHKFEINRLLMFGFLCLHSIAKTCSELV